MQITVGRSIKCIFKLPQLLLNARMKSHLRRGVFIALEGIDRCGKSTHVGRLVKVIQGTGARCIAMHFPARDTPTGKILDQYLQSGVEIDAHAVHLMFSANRWEASGQIRSHLSRGTHVVVDRYAYSGTAYTVARGEGITPSWCKAPDVGLPRPDLVIRLCLSPTAAKARSDYGKERFEKEAFQMRVSRAFDTLYEEDTWTDVDVDRDVDVVADEIAAIAMAAIEQSSTQEPIGRLWASELGDGCPGSVEDE